VPHLCCDKAIEMTSFARHFFLAKCCHRLHSCSADSWPATSGEGAPRRFLSARQGEASSTLASGEAIAPRWESGILQTTARVRVDGSPIANQPVPSWTSCAGNVRRRVSAIADVRWPRLKYSQVGFPSFLHPAGRGFPRTPLSETKSPDRSKFPRCALRLTQSAIAEIPRDAGPSEVKGRIAIGLASHWTMQPRSGIDAPRTARPRLALKNVQMNIMSDLPEVCPYETGRSRFGVER